jgi:hypothetical protein
MHESINLELPSIIAKYEGHPLNLGGEMRKLCLRENMRSMETNYRKQSKLYWEQNKLMQIKETICEHWEQMLKPKEINGTKTTLAAIS